MANIGLFLFSFSYILFFTCEGQVSSTIRLVDGTTHYEGRVEVYRNGQWQTVCDDSWDIEEAEVVCRQLGYGYAILAIQAAAFGLGSGGQWAREWSCSGNEGSLDGCSSSSTYCSHSEDASVICSRSALGNGAVRLVDTESTQFGGRLEIYYDSEWGTVCDDSWGSSDAAVACRQMGFVGVSNSDSSRFGSGSSQPIWLDNVVCSGSESRLTDCNHAGIGNEDCVHNEDVGIVCTIGTISSPLGDSSEIRLIGGRNQYEGRVEVYRSGEWQTICDNEWDINEAEVVCRQLGYGYAIVAIEAAAFGQGSGGQWARDWSCSGNEGSLDGCSGSSAICSHSEDASVICSSSALDNGALRLVETVSTQFGGRLEIYYNSEWGTVCDDSWDASDAAVACRQMSFVGVSVSDSTRFGYGSSSQSIWLDDVACSGSEAQLSDCNHAGFGHENCGHNEDVGIVCTNVDLTAIIGAAVGGAVGGALCIGLVLCICISVCCFCQKKKARNRTAASDIRVSTVQPVAVAFVSQTATQDGLQGDKPPEYTPFCDPTQQARFSSYSATYTVPAPYPTAGGTLPPAYLPTAGETLPLTYPPVAGAHPPTCPPAPGGILPPTYPPPGGTLLAGYPPQQLHPAQPPDLPPPYPGTSPFIAPQ